MFKLDLFRIRRNKGGRHPRFLNPSNISNTSLFQQPEPEERVFSYLNTFCNKRRPKKKKKEKKLQELPTKVKKIQATTSCIVKKSSPNITYVKSLFF